MQQELKKYLDSIGLELNDSKIDIEFFEHVKKILKEKLDTKIYVEKSLTYLVPKLTPDGSCSITEELDDEPYDLKKIFLSNNFTNEEIHKLIYKLDKVVKFLYDETGSDWTGIYKKLNTKSGSALVKLAYRGKPSRAEFPLTKKFAEHSNNSTVGLTGKAVLVNSVQKHLQDGKPYYKCDGKVESELCVPIFSKDKEIIGIIDLESFKENFFDEEKIVKVATICILLSDSL